jgi:hypothetical protein
MYKLDWIAAGEWAAKMASTLISEGYAPVVMVGAKLLDGDDMIFAVATGPGVTKEMVRETLSEILISHDAGKVSVQLIDYHDDSES